MCETWVRWQDAGTALSFSFGAPCCVQRPMKARGTLCFRTIAILASTCGSAACGSAGSSSASTGPASPDPIECGRPLASGSPIDLPHDGDNGTFDPSLELDPATGRLWMSYSSVLGPGGSARVSTNLAYSEDGGATWCLEGVVNAAESVAPADLPEAFRERPSHWNHEVSTLVRDAAAPEEARWKLLWHRFLVADDGVAGTDDRQFAFGWIGLKSAATPSALLRAEEQKLFVATGYASVRSFNDTIIGPPLVDFSTDPSLSRCLAFT
ncbi:MAG: hypothetical protein AAF658_07535, partial [Myxococcota bacterium]